MPSPPQSLSRRGSVQLYALYRVETLGTQHSPPSLPRTVDFFFIPEEEKLTLDKGVNLSKDNN